MSTNAPISRPAKRQKMLPQTVSQESELPDLNSELVEVETFIIHKHVLCKTSAFLQAALKPAWQGSGTRPVDLTDEHPLIFKMYLQWLYSNKVAVKGCSYLIPDINEPFDSWCAATLARAYVLGATLMDSAYQNAVLQAFMDMVEAEDGVPFMLMLAVDVITRERRRDREEFADDLIAALMNHRVLSIKKEDRPWVKDAKAYYVQDT
ncbi:hypothetical protein CC86DRAFT_405609 [Ophiobolus disseminans]|uniref:BTB domain-containing protein n=1 Tax=Ophiobolus disseminans TaxID=1469910 RepID=A0A6A7A3U8_9PLEO|nr:hypothetical protein CC86DRAFT_405609 [Ophiobolus disseminans]